MAGHAFDMCEMIALLRLRFINERGQDLYVAGDLLFVACPCNGIDCLPGRLHGIEGGIGIDPFQMQFLNGNHGGMTPFEMRRSLLDDIFSEITQDLQDHIGWQ